MTLKTSMPPKPFSIVLVGATNVGKSTLFNRLTRSRDAIVCDRPGVTVDRHEKCIKNDFVGEALVIDTGGIGPSLKKDILGQEIERAALLAVEEASVVCFLVDALREPGPEEFEIAETLRKRTAKNNVPIFLLANKADSKKFDIYSQFQLGFAETLPIAAEHGTGIDELWEKLAALKAEFTAQQPSMLDADDDWGDAASRLEEQTDEQTEESEDFAFADESSELADEEESSEEAEENASGEERPFDDKPLDKPFRLIVLGRPNVGKSTLLNALLGQERHVVSDVAGTTRDVIESQMQWGRRDWTLIDTAGMRRPGRLERDVEWVAREKLKDAAHASDVAILVVDTTQGISDLDASIAGMALDYGLSLVVALNKWDQVTGEAAHDMLGKLERTLDLKLGGFEWCPVVQISALTGKGLKELLKTIDKIKTLRTQRVKTAKLNEVFERKIRSHPHPAALYGKMPKFYYASQVRTSPPEFVVFANIPEAHVHQSYRRYVENTFRKEFEFVGTPIKLHFKNKRENEARRTW